VDIFKTIAQILANLTTVGAAAAAAWWFFFSGRVSRRVEFNVDLDVFESGDPKRRILQVTFLLDNKGFVEHQCYTLAFEVVEMRSDGTSASASDQSEGFVFRSGNVVERDAQYYYVRPGVCQRIVHTVSVPAEVELAKVRAFFTYFPNRLEIDRNKPTMPQRLVQDDWTSLVRVADLTSKGAVRCPAPTQPGRS
jgi:hypothetical protein